MTFFSELIVKQPAENRYEIFTIHTSTKEPKNELLLASCGPNSKWYFSTQNGKFNNERIRKSSNLDLKFTFVNGTRSAFFYIFTKYTLYLKLARGDNEFSLHNFVTIWDYGFYLSF